ncbi:MAG: hypothetical protein ACI9MR_004869 [Myxococcota bacterium]|jgi:hypothetical protein
MRRESRYRAPMRTLGLMWMAALLVPLATPAAAAVPVPTRPSAIERTTPKPPWFRRRPVPKTLQASGQGLIDLTRWPAEPTAPDAVDPAKFGAAMKTECAYMPANRKAKWTEWMLESSAEFGADPFLVAAIATERGACRPSQSNEMGIGLSGMQVKLHSGYFKRKNYKYWVLQKDRWVAKSKPMKRYLFYERALEMSRSAIYFTAGLLSVLEEQCPDIDGAFGSVPHRHHVSHFVWGDRARDADAEDRILTARRRLLTSYGAITEPVGGKWRDIALRSPLDGAPRKLTSVWGDDRDGGSRRHVGIDFATTRGEPVRAIADGKVFFAGVNLSSGATTNMSLKKAQALKRSQVGKAGFLVKIKHASGLVSASMHLDEYYVAAGQTVQQGDMIGRVGRTGIRSSPAHLHFELRHAGERFDPQAAFGNLVIGPDATWRGRQLAAEKRRLRRRRRRAK